MSPARVLLHGASGKMGRSIAAAVVDRSDVVIAASDLADLARCDVAIDFTRPDGTIAIARACATARVPLVVGTTGLGPDAERALEEAAKVVPIVVAPNMSVGVTVLFELAAIAAKLLGPDFDAEIIEVHHAHKVDAPSGTATRLFEAVADAKGLPRTALRTDRSGERSKGDIGVVSLRGGDVVGDHTLVLAGPGERVELTHRAHGREIFARGALRAALWVRGRAPGRYDMRDVLG